MPPFAVGAQGFKPSLCTAYEYLRSRELTRDFGVGSRYRGAMRAAAGQRGDAAAGERSALAEPGWRTSRCGRARLEP